jgi:DNA-binding TFAR19-related protein (PDSD5 family)
MRTVLRQDKVADFIHATKGQKYSEVLPLLGLQDLEIAAENLKKLRTQIEEQADVAYVQRTLPELLKAAEGKLGSTEPREVLEIVTKLAARHNIDIQKTLDVESASNMVAGTLEQRVKALEPAQQRHVLLKQILEEDVKEKLTKVKLTRDEAFKALDHQIEVIIQAGKIAHEISDISQKIPCPACGRPVCVQELQAHLDDELRRLKNAIDKREEARAAGKEYIESVKHTLALMKNEHLRNWLSEPANVETLNAFNQLDGAHLPDDIDEWPVNLSATVESATSTILQSVTAAVSTTPPSTQQLLDDLSVVSAASSLVDLNSKSKLLKAVSQFTKELETGEESIRHFVRSRVEDIVSQCSSEIQRLWKTLHPDEPIEDIRLTASEDKAVDIELKFFGREQSSPRLTLSEGHRNSLSLCIFLALADLRKPKDNPIILDDIVSSLDRDHRGRIVDLLVGELKERQIILFTHDREWYAELRSRLPVAHWNTAVLKPWVSPDIGLQFAISCQTFDDARSITTVRPESAGNTVRSIMDQECAIAAEALQISVRFRRGDENDRRTCVEFLDKMCAEARKRLKRDSGGHCDEVVQSWNKANSLLKAWANRASHTGSMVIEEANELIDACDDAVKKFRCDQCKDPFWIAEVKAKKRVQCSCGGICWDLS